jgi:16S rRNA (cytidine1402-2'-O)-methyltransferase
MKDRAVGEEPAGPRERSTPGQRLEGRVTAEIEGLMSQPLAPGLYFVATPIGNMADITLRALSVLARADQLYCEDTRHSRKLLARYGISRSPAAYHEHNADRIRPRILEALAAHRSVALVSDAGTPLISDPGFKLARAALDQGYPVIAIPGPSAVLAALTVSGLPTDSFLFVGFLPPRSAARRARLAELKNVAATLVFFESPSRLAAMFDDLTAVLGDRFAAVARELTKLHEEVRRDTLSRLSKWAGSTDVRGELVVLVSPPSSIEVSDEAILARLEAALETMSVRDAVKSVAEALGANKSRVYDLAVDLRRRQIE